jgi:hypothetical protein
MLLMLSTSCVEYKDVEKKIGNFYERETKVVIEISRC